VKLVLASTSAIRRTLLARLRIPFEAVAPGIDEEAFRKLPPRAQALALARAKAAAVAAQRPKAIVLAADQLVCCAGKVLGKPGSEAAAIEQLRWMRGRTAVLFTAAVLQSPDHEAQACVIESEVVLRGDLSDAEIEAYVRCERPIDSAGAFYAESLGIALFAEVRSPDPTAILGLPMLTICNWLRPLQRLCQRSKASGQGESSPGAR